MYKKLFYAILSIWLLVACEKTLDFNHDRPSPVLVLSGIVEANNNIGVYIAKSSFILDLKTDTTRMSDVNVNLYEDDNLIGPLSYTGYSYYEIDYKAKISHNYRIEADYTNFENIEAEINVLDTIPFTLIDTSTQITQPQLDYSGLYSENLKLLNIKLQFKDQPDEENYYQLKVYQYYSFHPDNVYPTYIINNDENSDDEFFEDYKESLSLFSDQLFDGDEHTINFSIYHPQNNIDAYYEDNNHEPKIYNAYTEVQLCHVSKEFYLHQKSLSSHMDTKDNPIAESVSVYTNIKNGLGILCSRSRNSRKIIFTNN